MPRIFWFFLVTMMTTWLYMNLWMVPRIEQLTGGLRIFDMRFTGYSYADAQIFITALGERGVALYLGTQFWLDMIFPPLLGAVLFLMYRWLFPGWAGLTIATISLSSVIVDYLENFAVAAMLRAGADNITPEMVVAANQWTTLKWSLALVGITALGFGMLLRLRRR